jgi:hypothetical protein
VANLETLIAVTVLARMALAVRQQGDEMHRCLA